MSSTTMQDAPRIKSMSNTTWRAVSRIRSMPLWQALLYFGLPALLYRLCIYLGTPALMRWGLTPFEASTVCFTVPSAILFALALGFSKGDGYGASWSTLKARLRLLPMQGRDWLWAVGALVVTFLSMGLLGLSAQILVQALPTIAPPDFFPNWLRPGAALTAATFADYIRAPLQGNWGVAVLFFVMLFFNIAGEELWWRGYILPRQEETHGRAAWAINGALWWLWHLTFYPWQVLALLPICLAVPFVVQRRRNTWVALIIHVQNGAVLMFVLAMVLGIVR
jgi:membrane protease YdiL (CAAX protease family)